jgi:hypothetical protein
MNAWLIMLGILRRGGGVVNETTITQWPRWFRCFIKY